MTRDHNTKFSRTQITAIYSLPELFAASESINIRHSARQDNTVVAIQEFYAPLLFGGQIYRIRLLAKEQTSDTQPNKLHSYSIEDIIIEKESPAVNTSTAVAVATPGNMTLRELGLRVNPDSFSKVVDENGEPLVLYHGTQRNFDAFRPPIPFWHRRASQQSLKNL